MIFGKYINRYYLKHAPALLLGLAALLMVDYIQLLIPQLYRLVINGMNLGQVVVNGETLPFTKEVLLQHICLPMIWIVVLMVIGRFLWRVCFFGSAVRVTADLRERMFDHSRKLSQQYYQVNKVGNLMSLYTNDLDTIQECFGDGVLMFFDALTLGLLALYKMWRMDVKLTVLALIPAFIMFTIGTLMGKVMTKRWEERQQAFSDLSDFAQELSKMQDAAEQARSGVEIRNREALCAIIKSKTEAYIWDKAQELDLSVSIEVMVEADGSYPYPSGVQITGAFTPQQRKTLEAYIEENLAIVKERQIWTNK